MSMTKHPLLLVIAGPSGVGKSTICEQVLAEFPEFRVSVSTTTRAPREGEVDGQHYHFVSREAFEAACSEDRFIEWATVHGNLYGTSKDVVIDALSAGHSLLFDIDYQGAFSLKQTVEDAILLMLLPPSMPILEERLRGRGTDSEEVIRERIDNARHEIAQVDGFDYAIVNDDIDRAYSCVRAVIEAERAAVGRNKTLMEARFPEIFVPEGVN